MSLPGWMKLSSCIPHMREGDDPWHPDDELPGKVQAAMFEQGRVVCAACPVQVQCGRRGLELIETDGVDGMYGGMTPDQLRAIARTVGRPTRKVAQHGTRARYVNYKCHCPLCRAANAQAESARRAGIAYRESA